MIIDAIFLGVLNTYRGRSAFPKPVLWFLAAVLIVPHDITVPKLGWVEAFHYDLFFATLVGLVFAWGYGKFFMVFHGGDFRDEKEFAPADATLEWLERKVGRLPNRVYGAVGMFIRWTVPSIPLFLYVSGSQWLIHTALFGALATASYAANRVTDFIPALRGSVIIAEILVFASFYMVVKGW